jgi:hypothetical protein
MPRMRTPVLLAVLALGVLAAACRSGDPPAPPEPTATLPTPVTTTPATDPTPAEEPSPEPSPSPVLEDGRHFGSIRSVDAEARTLRFDLAYFLTGDAANQAAAERGDEVPVPNDVYVVNDNPKLRTLPIAPDLEVWVIDPERCCDPVRGKVGPFLKAFATRHHPWDALYRGRQAPYWITVQDGVVVRIEVQYLP